MMSRIQGRTVRTMIVTGAVALSLGVGSLGGIAVAQTAATPEAGIEVPPDLPPRISEAGAQPLSINDCTAPEKSRDVVMDILRTPPKTSAIFNKPKGDEPDFRPWTTQNPSTGMTPVAEEEFDVAEAVFREWQVCKMLGLTWQQMSLETDQVIREDVYGDTRIMTAYSDAALTEVLNARVEADAAWGEHNYGPGIVAQRPPMAIDRDGWVQTSAEGDYMIVEVVDVFEANDEQVINPAGTVAFWKVDGVWLVDRVDLYDR
ncbi:MAG: hypothetical protein QM753_07720 [Thermomicrobiales bacterium]